jgi:hypothetical protein
MTSRNSSKPRLFLTPLFGLGNRLIMITSALRIAEKMDYELVIVWLEDHIYGGDKHFHGPFSTYFSANIDETTFPLREKRVFLPRPTGEAIGGFTICDSTFDGTDLYILEWTHNIFLSSDQRLSTQLLTSQLFDYLARVINPTERIHRYISENYECTDRFEINNYLGIHIRKGANISNGATDYLVAHSISNSAIAMAALRVVQHLSITSVFICGQVHNDIREVVMVLRSFGLAIMSHSAATFPFQPGADHVNSAVHSDKMITDFVLLQKSRHVLSSSLSTFSALASFRPRGLRFVITPDESVHALGTELGSGSGI